MATTSSGYDSLAATVLARAMGCEQALCVPQDREGQQDNAIELVRQLGLEPLVVERAEWRKVPFVETSFIAADACGRDIWIAGAGDALRGRIVLTGNFGDTVWALPWDGTLNSLQHTHSNRPIGTNVMSFIEYRLAAGFQHCPVPFLGIASMEQLPALGRSDEMRPWLQDGFYDRPLPRRIIEDAGIERGSFGTRKTATAVHLFRRAEFDRFMVGQPSMLDFLRWLRTQSEKKPPPPGFDSSSLTTTQLELIEVPLFRHLFPWALDRWRRQYRSGMAPITGP